MKTLEQKVMARVRRMYYIRKAVSPTALKMYTLVGTALGLVSLVSVTNVIANMPSPLSMLNFFSFFSSAFRNTEATVQVLFAGLCVFTALVLRDVFQAVRGVNQRLSLG